MSENLRDVIPEGAAFDFLRADYDRAANADLPPRYLQAIAFGWMTASEAVEGYSRERRAAEHILSLNSTCGCQGDGTHESISDTLT